ncbi:MAG: DNA polymerase III subunit beta [Pelatocladus maniniholoensis HA4357-MV3]|jgi:DNA polymerase-3 subunit beta|uniref:DNA polymerase III subunit beta n=1 Tax=Pelatocladus maniniholoensis HA4357-MV3 TaxID=1117104 RepID=A0A9E3H9D7_9NOST|nr:DNA polymerase III subunit beta [Pelatocladus maniniholoensis HA4357-MV3]
MKITISQKDLSDILSLVNYAVPNKPYHPILNNVLLIADKDNQKIAIAAFDLSLGIRVECKCKIENDGMIALPAKLLAQLVSNLPKQDINLEIVDNTAILTHSSGKCRIQTVNPQEFPSLPQAGGKTITLSAVKLLQALEATLFAASHDETKLVLAGVHFKFARNYWEAAATDGHRLAVASGTIELSEESNGNAKDEFESDTVKVTIPYQTLTELQKILASVGEDCECTISIDNGIAVFDLANIQITSRLLSGEYPQYASFIPQQFQHQFTIDRKVFDNALKRVGIVADQKDKIVAINFDYTNQQATLSTESQDVGGAVESVLIKAESNFQHNLLIGFNIKYITDALKFIPTDEVLLQANRPTTPVIIIPVGGILNQLILVMPIELIATKAAIIENSSEINEEPVITEDILPTTEVATATTEIADEVEIAAKVMEETAIEENVEIITNSSAPESTEETTTTSPSPSTPTTKPKGRKKKAEAA